MHAWLAPEYTPPVTFLYFLLSALAFDFLYLINYTLSRESITSADRIDRLEPCIKVQAVNQME